MHGFNKLFWLELKASCIYMYIQEQTVHLRFNIFIERSHNGANDNVLHYPLVHPVFKSDGPKVTPQSLECFITQKS